MLSKMKYSKRVAAVSSLTTLASLGFVRTAGANNWGSTPRLNGVVQNEVSLGGGGSPSVHSVSFHSFGNNALRQSTIDALQNVYAPTNLTIQFNADNTSADVRLYDDDFGLNGVFAWVNCPDGATRSGADPLEGCFNQTLKYNLAYTFDDTFYTSEGRKYMACHELGHTVGLRHTSSSSSCMVSDVDYPWPLNLETHEIDGWINQAY